MKLSLAQVLLTLMIFVRVAHADPVILDIDGIARRPLEIGDRAGSVLIFYWHDCPICNSYAPEINRLARVETNFSFYIVQVDADLTPADAARHAKAYGIHVPVLLDGKHRLVKLAGATATPEAIVYGTNKTVLYRGRIDNVYASLSQRRETATTHDLRDALHSIAIGKLVTNQIPAIGCAIQ